MFKIVHASDLHLQKGWAEEQTPVLTAFFKDLENRGLQKGRDVFVFSGDLIAEGNSLDQIAEFKECFATTLDKHFDFSDRFFCPGNHEIDREYTKENLSLLLPLARTHDDETKFNNDIISNSVRTLIEKKFTKCLGLASGTFGGSLTSDNFPGGGFSIAGRCAIYILNSALYSFGGLRHADGEKISDKELLRIETRNLRKWIDEHPDEFKILVTHHPAEWLMPWAKKALENVAKKHFDLLLQGHEHEPSAVEKVYANGRVVVASAPALHTSKDDPYLGYTIISIEPSGSISIEYRQWSPIAEDFVTGSVIAGVDSGIIRYRSDLSKNKTTFTAPNADLIRDTAQRLQAELAETMSVYKSLSKEFIAPRLSTKPEFDLPEDDSATIETLKAVADNRVLAIFAPQLFGLSTLGRYISAQWWTQTSKLLAYLEIDDLPGHKQGVSQYLEQYLRDRGLATDQLDGFVINSPKPMGKGESRRIQSLKELFPLARFIFLQRMEAADISPSLVEALPDIPYKSFYLRSMPREHVRALVRAEIERGVDHDEDYITQRIIDDIEVLNIHRTPLHVKTLLAIASERSDVGPINRAEMLMQFLHIIFHNNINFGYETVPDLKDSAFAIGLFCAELLKADKRYFSKKEFLARIDSYCEEKAVDLDVPVIFDVLERERLIVMTMAGYVFNYTYWIYFFAAHHMYASEDFRKYVLEEFNYSKYPEVIEFYSAIDRHRSELISTLTDHLRIQRKAFESRSQIPIGANIFDLLKWKVDHDTVANMEKNLETFLEQTDLPTEVKDQIADQEYDYSKPYSQELRNFIDQQSLAKNIHIMIAAARALRNSDHVDKTQKALLLREIMFIWKQLLQAATLQIREMVVSQRSHYEDVLFVADWTAKENAKPDQIAKMLLEGLPITVGKAFYTDLATRRMGPLFESALAIEQDGLLKFFIVTQVLMVKPKNWVSTIGDYIAKVEDNSYYLWALNEQISQDYQNGFNGPEVRKGLRTLLGRVVAKHQLKIANPNNKTAQRIEEQIREAYDKAPYEKGPDDGQKSG